MNLPENAAPSQYAMTPGTTILLPDGGRTVIEEILPNGDFRTGMGQIVSPEGIVLSGPNQGERIVVEGGSMMANPDVQINIPGNGAPNPESGSPAQEAAPQVAVETPKTEKNTVVEVPAPEKTEQPAWKRRAQEQRQQNTPAVEEKPSRTPATGKSPETEPEKTPQHRITIAEMLPTTKVPEKEQAKPKEKPKQPEKAKEAPKPKPAHEQPEKKKPDAKKVEPKKVEQPKSKPREKPQKYEKPKVGQEMRIPPDAAARGDLSFLEGCWQGTRPEYYSKRTIRECFCFGANGSGKRRVIDPSGHRMCIGATRANLSKSGVLSVTSEGAACTDGERWGSAEMVCRNSGPKTPCSWVFRDANNGRQAYTIPFLRVESCGR